MQVLDKTSKSLGLGTKHSHPIHLAERLHIDEILGGYVAILADIGYDSHQEFFLLSAFMVAPNTLALASFVRCASSSIFMKNR